MAVDRTFEEAMLNTLFETPLDRAVAHAEAVLRDGYCGAQLTERQARLLYILLDRKGLARALPIGQICERLGCAPRDVKGDVRDLRLVFRVRVGSSRDADGGVYLIATAEEAISTVTPFARQAVAEFEIVRAICEPHEMKELAGQLRLDQALLNGASA